MIHSQASTGQQAAHSQFQHDYNLLSTAFPDPCLRHPASPVGRRQGHGHVAPGTALNEGLVMSQFIASTKHARYVFGSLTAVLFAACSTNS
jgi:hypothetical protein